MAVDSMKTEATWAPPTEILELASEEDFTKVQEIIKDAVRKVIRLHVYNNLDSFVNFHRAYRDQKELSLEQFIKVCPVSYEDSCISCVGLSYKVLKYISETEPSLSRYLFFAICNDFDLNTPDPKDPPPDELASLFDHMLVVLAFRFNDRKGYFFADNALLIDFPIVIMADGHWPHTGHFRSQSRDGHRESRVQMVNDAYVVWNQTDKKLNGKTVVRRRLIYLGRPFLQPDNVDRRANVIGFHGYILMGLGGFKAGLFILLGKDNRRLTLSVPNEAGEELCVQLPYEFFCSESDCDDPNVSSEETKVALKIFANMCGLGSIEALMKRFRRVSEPCMDDEFIEEAITLNRQYCAILNQFPYDSAT